MAKQKAKELSFWKVLHFLLAGNRKKDKSPLINTGFSWFAALLQSLSGSVCFQYIYNGAFRSLFQPEGWDATKTFSSVNN